MIRTRTQSLAERKIIDDTRKRSYIIEAQNPYKVYWDMLIILCALTTAFFVPVEIAFDSIDRTFDGYWITHVLDITVDIIFLIDIVVGFLSEFTDTASGDQIRNPKRIAINYMQGTFFFDAVSSLPFVIEALFRSGLKKLPGFASFLSFLRIFKLVRLRKIDTTIAELSWSKETKTQVRRVAAVLSLAIVMHVQACIIFTVLDHEKFWVAPLDFGNLSTDIWHSGKTNTYIYWKMMYHSALVFAMVDIGPRSIAEIVSLIVLIIAAAIITAVIYGLFGSYTE